jgi:LytS/YehU family sensor histidine kinase
VTNPHTLQQNRSRPSNKIALENLAARLSGCFEGDGLLKVDKNDQIYQITLEIPYRK